MFAYIIYAAKKDNPYLFADFKTGLTRSTELSTHSITIDPQKPSSQRNILEKAVTLLYRDEINQAIKNASHNGTNQYGDKITYDLEQHFEGEAQNAPIEMNYTMGITQGPDYLPTKLRDAKVGEKIEFTESIDGRIKKYSIHVKEVKKSTLAN